MEKLSEILKKFNVVLKNIDNTILEFVYETENEIITIEIDKYHIFNSICMVELNYNGEIEYIDCIYDLEY